MHGSVAVLLLLHRPSSKGGFLISTILYTPVQYKTTEAARQQTDPGFISVLVSKAFHGCLPTYTFFICSLCLHAATDSQEHKVTGNKLLTRKYKRLWNSFKQGGIKKRTFFQRGKNKNSSSSIGHLRLASQKPASSGQKPVNLHIPPC